MRRWLLVLCFALLMPAIKCKAAEPCYPPFATNYTKQLYPVPGLECFDYPACFLVVSWHCDLNYVWHSTFRVMRASHFVPDPIREYKRIMAMSYADKLDFDAQTFRAIDATDPDFGYTYHIAKGQRDATKPPAIVWIVKAYGTGTRPYYPVVNGVRRTTKAGDVRIGQPCACWRLVKEEGDSRMCDVSGVVAEPPTKLIPADHVALCVRQ